MDAYVGGQQPVEPTGERRRVGHRKISVRHLTGGVHPRVGTSGNAQPRCRRQVQDPGQACLELVLHSAPAGLRRPAGETAAVIAKVET